MTSEQETKMTEETTTTLPPPEEPSEETAAEAAAKWNLTSSVSPYLDLHMMFPLLEYVDSLISINAIPYSSSDVAAARLSLLKPTHMVDYAMDIYRELHGQDAEIPEEMEEQKRKVYEVLAELKADEGCKAFEDLCHNEELKNKLIIANEWNIAALTLKPELGITEEVIETYCQLSKFNFDCGDYASSKEMIEHILSLYAVPPLPKEATPAEGATDLEDRLETKDTAATANQQQQRTTGNPKVYWLTSINPSLLQLLWGKLSCEILLLNWEGAQEALTAVQLSIEQLCNTKQMAALEGLKQRTWLLHWSLFVFWNNSGSKGLESMVELFFAEKYLHAITTTAPHLLRYLTAAVLLCKRRLAKSSTTGSTAFGRNTGVEARRLMKDLIRVMNNCDYTDPIVEFVDCLCVKFDFEGARLKLVECKAVLKGDFFLCEQTDLFMEEARVFVFENYCRIHRKIDLDVLGTKLAMDRESAERWIVDLIRNALLDAKIDSEEGCVVMGSEEPSVYEQVMEKTRDLNLRSLTLSQNLRSILGEARKEKARKARAALEEEDY